MGLLRPVTYDEDLHITAGELRARNFTVPDGLPDDAYVLRSALVIDDVRVDRSGVGTTDEESAFPPTLKCTVHLRVTRPWTIPATVIVTVEDPPS